MAMVPKKFSPPLGIRTITIDISGDEATVLTTGAAKRGWHMPWPFIPTEIRIGLKTASSSGLPAVDINMAGASIFSTTITIDANAVTSVGAATPYVLTTLLFTDNAYMTADVDTAGTGAVGLKLYITGYVS